MNVLVGPLGWQQLPLLKELKENGYKLFGIDDNINAIGVDYCDVIVPGGLSNLEVTLDYIKESGINDEIVMLPLISDVAVRYFSNLAEALNRPKEIINEAFYNKLSLNELLLKNLLSSKKKWLPSGDTYGEWIIKPIEGSGSRGVSFISVRTESDITRLNQMRGFVIEERLRGEEYSVDGYIWKNEIQFLLSRRILLNNKTAKLIYPVSVNNELIKEKLRLFFQASDYSKGIFHIEIIIMEGRIEIIDAACRLGGFSVGTDYFYNVTGLDLFKVQVEISCASLGEIKPLKMCPTLLQMYYPSEDSVFTKLSLPVHRGIIDHSFISLNTSAYRCNEINDGSRLGYSLLTFASYRSLNEFIERKK